MHFCEYFTNTFGYKEMGHWGAKDVKVESALARYPDVFVLEIEQEQLPYKFLLPLCVSQIKSTIRVTSLTIFVSIFSPPLVSLTSSFAYSLKGTVQSEQYSILKYV